MIPLFYLIILGAIAFIGVMIVLKIIKGLLKIAFSLIGIVLVLIAIIAGIIIYDANHFNKNDKYIFLEQDQKIIMGIKIDSLKLRENDFAEEVDRDLDSYKNDSVIVMDYDYYTKGLPEEIKINSLITLDKQELINQMEENPVVFYMGFVSIIKEKDWKYISEGIKEDKIRAWPNMITYSALKYI